MATFLLFLLGAAFGSFLNVIALRYDPEKSLLGNGVLGGRSYCPHCRATLRWFELIPLVSFLIQGGKCRRCRAAISVRYITIEILCGLLVLLVPQRLGMPLASLFLFTHASVVIILWTFVFLTLLLMTLIDMRHMVIPDELNIFLSIIGSALIATGGFDSFAERSLVGIYRPLFGGESRIWQNHIGAALGALAFFVALVLLTRGRGMGIGDVKLAGALGLVFGWPDAGLSILAAFLFGGVFGLWALGRGKKTMKSAVPFGPFLALGAVFIFFLGENLLQWYVSALR